MNRHLQRASVLALALGLTSAFANAARAQAPTYVGTFALTNISSQKCTTDSNDAGSTGGTSTATTDTANGKAWAADPTQEWAFLLLPNGYFAIFNIKTGWFLGEATFKGAGTGFGITSRWTGDRYQQWYLYPFGNNVYALVNAGSGKALTDVTPPSNRLSVAADVPWTGGLDQLWYLYFLYK